MLGYCDYIERLDHCVFDGIIELSHPIPSSLCECANTNMGSTRVYDIDPVRYEGNLQRSEVPFIEENDVGEPLRIFEFHHGE